MEDIKDAWPVFIICVIISLVISYLFYYLLENCAIFMIFLMIFGSIGCLVGFGFFSWFKYQDLLKQSVKNESLADNYKTAAIVCWVFAGLFFLFVCCLFSKIKLAAKIISAAADFINERKISLLVPMILTGVTCIFVLWWVISFAYIFSTGELRYDPGDIFGDMTWSQEIYYSIWVMIFALLWFLSFILSTNIFIIAALTAGWYFARHDNIKESSLKTYFVWAWFYHLGSLAFGSFLIALLWLIQLILNYIYQKVKDSKSESMNFILKCLMCCVNCFERVLRYINKHAYIEIALRNYNFCQAARKSLSILTSNILAFATLTGLVELFLIMGTLIISLSVTFMGYWLLHFYGSLFNVEFDTIGPIFIIFLMSATISLLFNNIFEISADTMLHCYILEDHINSRRQFKEYQCPDKMMGIINELNAHKRLINPTNKA